MSYYVYILKSENSGKYYIGSKSNLEDRLKRHNEGRSKYTKHGIPGELLYSEQHLNRSSAIRREKQIKCKKSKEFIEALIRTSR